MTVIALNEVAACGFINLLQLYGGGKTDGGLWLRSECQQPLHNTLLPMAALGKRLFFKNVFFHFIFAFIHPPYNFPSKKDSTSQSVKNTVAEEALPPGLHFLTGFSPLASQLWVRSIATSQMHICSKWFSTVSPVYLLAD